MPLIKAFSSPAFRMRLRRFAPIHRPLAWFNRVARPALYRSFLWFGRTFIPSTSWFAPPRGFFSELESTSPSQVILRDQGSPVLPDPSIILLCQRTQHLQQPWPVFWQRHRNVRLVGRSLVHLNPKRELSLEAVYGLPRLSTDPAW